MDMQPNSPAILIIVSSIVGLYGLAAIGLLWAPFASLICLSAARARGLNDSTYAIAGATHSILLMLPWIYLILRMNGVRVHRLVAVLTYLLLYLAVMGLMVLYISFVYEGLVPLLDEEELRLSGTSLGSRITGNISNYGFILAIVCWHIVAVWRLVRRAVTPSDPPQGHVGLYGLFGGPFAVTWVSLVGFPALWVWNALLYLS